MDVGGLRDREDIKMDYYLMYGSWELTPGGVASKNGTQEEQSVDSKCREGLAPGHNLST